MEGSLDADSHMEQRKLLAHRSGLHGARFNLGKQHSFRRKELPDRIRLCREHGLSIKAVSRVLGIHEDTARSHVRKLGEKGQAKCACGRDAGHSGNCFYRRKISVDPFFSKPLVEDHILDVLQIGPLSSAQIWSAVKKHGFHQITLFNRLRILRENGKVKFTKSGKKLIYWL